MLPPIRAVLMPPDHCAWLPLQEVAQKPYPVGLAALYFIERCYNQVRWGLARGRLRHLRLGQSPRSCTSAIAAATSAGATRAARAEQAAAAVAELEARSAGHMPWLVHGTAGMPHHAPRLPSTAWLQAWSAHQSADEPFKQW